jgi:hypothetical protein
LVDGGGESELMPEQCQSRMKPQGNPRTRLTGIAGSAALKRDSPVCGGRGVDGRDIVEAAAAIETTDSLSSLERTH